MASPALFLDRDGTLNEDPGYLNEPDQLRILPGVCEALGRASQAGFKLVVISNQSGINRGLVDRSNLDQIHLRMSQELALCNGSIDLYLYCPHLPSEQCECRKPKGKLISDAARILDLDLSSSVMIGDRMSDLQAGQNAHVGRVALVRTGQGAKTERDLQKEAKLKACDFIGETLSDVVDWILNLDPKNVSS